MNCQDVAKLRTPLDAVCQTTDIGCVPIVDGKPTCSPQPDELPFAFDPKTTTLWIFSCDVREWVAFGKFSVCQLDALNLENISNICDVLNIAVNYAGSGECQQGTITLAELAERILECLKLETKIITIGEGDGNKLKITIDGLPLDPVYVTGRNIWSEGGSGTEADPLKVATHNPICKWPTRTQAEVDAANTKHLGACLDGEMARVPFPSTEKICEADQITLEQAKEKGNNLTVVGCDNGNIVRIPVSGSGLFDRDYICVPSVTSVPVAPPLVGTGPLRIGCNGELYVWICEESRWVQVTSLSPANLLSYQEIKPSIDDPCEDVYFSAWHKGGSSDQCVDSFKLNTSNLVDILRKCGLGMETALIGANYRMCIGFKVETKNTVFRGRDLTFIYGEGRIPKWGEVDPGHSDPDDPAIVHWDNDNMLEIVLVNNTDYDRYGVVDARGMVSSTMQISMNLIITEESDKYVDFYHGRPNPQTGFSELWYQEGTVTTPSYGNENFILTYEGSNKPSTVAAGGSVANAKFLLPAHSTRSYFAQYFLIFHEPNYGNYQLADVRMAIDGYLLPA